MEWESLRTLFDVNQPLVQMLGYSMSAVEFFGTIFNLLAVYLMARRNIWTWPIGMVGVMLFAALFYQIRLYGDFFEQIYYFFASLYGLWLWSRQRQVAGRPALAFSGSRGIMVGLAVTLGGGAALGWGLTQLPTVVPELFPEAPSLPYVDAVTTAGSFVAMVLEAKRRLEAWIYWTFINLIGVWLYLIKGVPFVAGLYVVFLGLGCYGYWAWWKALNSSR